MAPIGQMIEAELAQGRQDLESAIASERAAASAGTALQAAKVKAAEDIAKSNLTPEYQEVLFRNLDRVQTLEDARNAQVQAAKLPQRVVSNQDRDDYARAQFGGLSYGQLTPAQQEAVNARVLKEKATFNIQATDTGLFRINQRTGDVFQVGAPGSQAPGTVAAQAPGAGAAPAPVRSGAAPAPSEAVRFLAETYKARSPEEAQAALQTILASKMPQRAKARHQQAYDLAHGAKVEQGFVPTTPELTALAEDFRAAGPRAAKTQLDAVLGSDAPQSVKSMAQQAFQMAQGPAPVRAPLPFDALSPFAQQVSDPRAGEPVFGAKTPTADQANAQGFGSMALSANETIRDLESKGHFGNDFWLTQRQKLQSLSPAALAGTVGAAGAAAGAAFGGIGAIPGAAVGGVIGGAAGLGAQLAAPMLSAFDTEAQRAYITAKLNFITSTLRKRSGAAISVGEFQNEEKRYFPQYGDSQEEIQRKAAAREQEIRSLQAESGRKLLVPQVIPFEGPPPAPQGKSAAPAPTGADVATGLQREQEALRQQLGALGAPPQQPTLALPVEPSAQKQTAPSVTPKATLPVDHMNRLMTLRGMASQAISQGAADEHLRAIGADTLKSQLSYYEPGQRRAIQRRIKQLGLQ